MLDVSRRLGQHFLAAGAAQRLVELVAPTPDDVFLEIGPGRGALTLKLAALAMRVVGVELDPFLVAALRPLAPPNVELIEGDALVAALRSFVPKGARLVGNLPYYISSPLLRRVLELRDHLRDAHVMLQAEVAQRVASPPGSKEYGVLSVLCAVWAQVDVVMRLGPQAFDPPPKVCSAVLRLRFHPAPAVPVGDWPAVERLVLRGFTRRRRTLTNNLAPHYPGLHAALERLTIDPTRRPETIAPAEWVLLAAALAAP